MRELRFLNYYTVYSYSSIDSRGRKTQIFNNIKSVCFRELFSTLKNICPKGIYTIFVSKDKHALENHDSNYCFLNENKITQHLKHLQQVVPEVLSYGVTPTVYDEYHGYEVTLIIDRANKQVHKYAITWIRYLYEACFSLALLDATRLAKLPQFRFVSYANLLNIIQACFLPDVVPDYNPGHSIGRMLPHKLYTKKELHQKISESYNLNNIYPVGQIGAYKSIPINPNIYNLDYWESEEIFINERLPIYESMYNKLKILQQFILFWVQ